MRVASLLNLFVASFLASGLSAQPACAQGTSIQQKFSALYQAALKESEIIFYTDGRQDEAQRLSDYWKANFPGVFMYHCGTGPVLQHISNGMYGAVVVDPTEAFAPAKEYVLVQSEFYLTKAASGNWEG